MPRHLIVTYVHACSQTAWVAFLRADAAANAAAVYAASVGRSDTSSDDAYAAARAEQRAAELDADDAYAAYVALTAEETTR
jgi:hypothetical protein